MERTGSYSLIDITRPHYHIFRKSLFLLSISGLIISGYLLYRHQVLTVAEGNQVDVCSTIFGKGCDGALSSTFSYQLGLPLAAWGVLYFLFLIALLFMQSFLRDSYETFVLSTTLIIALLAGIASSFFLILIVRNLRHPF